MDSEDTGTDSREAMTPCTEDRFASLPKPNDQARARQVAAELADRLEGRRRLLVEACLEEVGGSTSDAEEAVDAVIAVAKGFQPGKRASRRVPAAGGRSISIVDAPWGVVVAILPQNAVLHLAVTCLLYALDAGNAVVLRVPKASDATAVLLAECLEDVPEASVVQSGAPELLSEFYRSRAPGLIHYFGGSGRIPDLMADSFRAGKGLIADGSGNTWAFVDDPLDLDVAAKVLAEGATRYAGQTCTSVVGAVIHPSMWDSLIAKVEAEFRALPSLQVGGAEIARGAAEIAQGSGGSIVIGGSVDDDRMSPTLVIDPSTESALLREGAFGPVLWLRRGDGSTFERLWALNRYPLCAAVLGENVDVRRWCALPNLARLVINGDPSLEDPLEPWGGYPCSGNSSVAAWSEKYVRTVQVDRP